MITKKWWQSKTMWLNGLSALFGSFLLITPYIDAAFLNDIGISNTKPVLAIIGIINTVGNVMLRKGGQPTAISTKPAGSYIQDRFK